MYFPQLLLIWLDPFFERNDVLDYLHVIGFQIIVRPCKNIFVLFEKVDKGLQLLRCQTCIEIDELWILFYSKVDQFGHHGGTVGFVVPWPLKSFLQVIDIFQ